MATRRATARSFRLKGPDRFGCIVILPDQHPSGNRIARGVPATVRVRSVAEACCEPVAGPAGVRIHRHGHGVDPSLLRLEGNQGVGEAVGRLRSIRVPESSRRPGQSTRLRRRTVEGTGSREILGNDDLLGIDIRIGSGSLGDDVADRHRSIFGRGNRKRVIIRRDRVVLTADLDIHRRRSRVAGRVTPIA